MYVFVLSFVQENLNKKKYEIRLLLNQSRYICIPK